MLILRNIVITLLLLTLAAIAVVGVMVEAPAIYNWTPDRINALGRSVLDVMRPGYLLFMVWWLVLLALLLVFLITVGRPSRRMKIEVQMGGGRVVIMDAAIKKYIRNALAEMGDVNVKKIDLREHRNLVTTDIYTDVRTRENLPTLERRIISRVRSALAEDLGITNLGDVHVFIRNFEVTGRPIKAASAEKADKPAADKPPVVEREVQPADTKAPATSAVQESSTAASASTVSAEADAGIPAHALAEPVEPPGSTEPIVIDDADADAAEQRSRDAGTDTFELSQPVPKESSVSEPVDTKGKQWSAQSVDIAEPMSDSAPADHEDLDHSNPWAQSRPGDDDQDKEDRGPLPL